MTANDYPVEEDPRYLEAAQQIQQGAWEPALRSLLALVEEYPSQEAELVLLLEHVQARMRDESATDRPQPDAPVGDDSAEPLAGLAGKPALDPDADLGSRPALDTDAGLSSRPALDTDADLSSRPALDTDAGLSSRPALDTEEFLYLETMRHIQEHNWEEALALLTGALDQFPHHREDLLDLMAQVEGEMAEDGPLPNGPDENSNGAGTPTDAERPESPAQQQPFDGITPLEEIPAYQAAQDTMQAGDWETALQQLVRLGQHFPEHQAELLPLLEQVQDHQEAEAAADASVESEPADNGGPKWHQGSSATSSRVFGKNPTSQTPEGVAPSIAEADTEDSLPGSSESEPDAERQTVPANGFTEPHDWAGTVPESIRYTYASSLEDPRYGEAARHLQESAWDKALPLLMELQHDYPDQQDDILPLIDQVQVKTSYRQAEIYVQQGEWDAALRTLRDLTHKYPEQEESFRTLLEQVEMKALLDQSPIRGRTWLAIRLFNRRRLARLAIAAVLILILGGAWYGYRAWVEPARQLQLQRALLAQTLASAKDALAEAQYRQAIDLFEQVLGQDSSVEEARVGLATARKQMGLNDQYGEAILAAEQGESERALALFQDLRDQAPGYRDVDDRIQAILDRADIETLFVQAESAYQGRRWSDAISLYTTLRQRSVTHETAAVESHLYDSYLQLAFERSHLAGLSDPQIEDIIALYRGALSLNPMDPLSRSGEQLLTQYQQAKTMLQRKQHSEAVAMLTAVYNADAALLGGDAAGTLFEAHFAYGRDLEGLGNLWGALEQYQAAASLPVDQSFKAKLAARAVALALTPTPTPTPTVTPTPTPDPFQEFLKELPPTPVPPSPLEEFTGWIVFRSDRPGSRSGLWVMKPDGSSQQPVIDANKTYEHLRQQVQWSQDNLRRIYVENTGGEAVSIYLWRYDIPLNWTKDVRAELLNNSGINYQPAFSPDEEHIVFTSQRTNSLFHSGDGQSWGDEIFILHMSEVKPGGQTPYYRLTFNTWEWDKYPTFSLDGQTIAFWSNRVTGRAQIWAMDVDGGNQRNLSNSEWNDWDPLFIAPRRELPDLYKLHEEPPPGIGPAFDPSQLDMEEE